jgi:hypothetical protein
MRIALAILMTFHGIAHLAGFAGAWQLAPEGFPYRTTVLDGRVDLGNAGIRVVGVLWLALAIAFVTLSVSAVGGAAWWPPAALGVATVSLLLSVMEFPEARLGVVINILIIAALAAGRWLGRI